MDGFKSFMDHTEGPTKFASALAETSAKVKKLIKLPKLNH